MILNTSATFTNPNIGKFEDNPYYVLFYSVYGRGSITAEALLVGIGVYITQEEYDAIIAQND